MGKSQYQRIPFEEAINDKLLFKKSWDELSPPQQSALRVFYGLELDEEGLRHFSIFTERATFDDLGFVKDVQPATDYVPLEHDEAVVVFGRRSAKTSGFLAFVLAYEAVLGGHTLWAKTNQQVVSFMVAQKLDIAQAILRDFVEPLISSSKLLEKEIVKSNTDGIVLKNGHRIAPAPPVIKNFRYFAIPIVAMDEASFWYKDADSANPDFEVVRACTPAQGQFPHRKLVIASTIWSKEGMVFEAKEAGSYGHKLPKDDDRRERYKHTLVMVAPTPAMQNPLMSDRKWFEREFNKDEQAYKREILNQAVDGVASLFSETLLRKAIEGQPSDKRKPAANHYYTASMDPAFRGDDFTFTIGHYEPELGFVQDLLKRWTPTHGVKLSPSLILDEIAVDLKEYNCDTIFSDQYQLESLQQLALDRGFAIVGLDYSTKSKPKMFGSFLQLLRNERVKLLRDSEQFKQFSFIQRTVGNGGYIRISAPSGKHDDTVTVTVMCCAMAIRMESDVKVPVKEKEVTLFDKVMESIAHKQNQAPIEDGYL